MPTSCSKVIVFLVLISALTQDFLTILDRCPSKLKKKILTWKVCIEKKKPELVSVAPIGFPRVGHFNSSCNFNERSP